MKSTQEKHDQVIEHLIEKYNLSTKELKLLEEIKNKIIHSICFTTEGGFNCDSGEFYSEERANCYKIKIKYEEKHSQNLEVVYLMPSAESRAE